MKLHYLPLTLDKQYLEDAAMFAERYGGVRAFHLSHRLVHHADDVMNDAHRLAQIRDMIRLLKDRNFQVWCWTHEIYDPPEECVRNGRLDLDHPRLPPHLKHKYECFLKELLPGLEGLVLTFAETQYEVYKNKNVDSRHSDGDASARKTRQLVDWLLHTCKEMNVGLAVRDFVYRDKEVQEMLKAIRSLSDEVYVMSKCVPHDWQPYYPDNPVLGQVRPKRQWIEFDLGHEYEMQTAVPFAEPELLLKRIRHARSLGIDTCCLRLDRYDAVSGSSAIYKPWGRLELQVFARYAANPDIRLEDIIIEWEKEHFPGASHVLGLATEVARRMLFPQKLWLANHSNLPTYDYARTHLKDGNADRLPVWTGASEDRLAEQLCDRPTEEWLRILQADDEKTRFFLDVIFTYIERHAAHFDNNPQWLEGMQLLRSWEELFRYYKSAYFAVRLIRYDPQALTAREVRSRIDLLEEACGMYKERHPELKLSGKYAWEAHPKVIESLRMQLE